jgi:starch phosphorylase
MIRQTTSIQNVLDSGKIVYFSMEIGLIPETKTYSGGLGVLAGDIIRSTADLNVPVLFLDTNVESNSDVDRVITS